MAERVVIYWMLCIIYGITWIYFKLAQFT